jgi:hypothetical protein
MQGRKAATHRPQRIFTLDAPTNPLVGKSGHDEHFKVLKNTANIYDIRNADHVQIGYEIINQKEMERRITQLPAVAAEDKDDSPWSANTDSASVEDRLEKTTLEDTSKTQSPFSRCDSPFSPVTEKDLERWRKEDKEMEDALIFKKPLPRSLTSTGFLSTLPGIKANTAAPQPQVRRAIVLAEGKQAREESLKRNIAEILSVYMLRTIHQINHEEQLIYPVAPKEGPTPKRNKKK